MKMFQPANNIHGCKVVAICGIPADRLWHVRLHMPQESRLFAQHSDPVIGQGIGGTIGHAVRQALKAAERNLTAPDRIRLN